MSTKSIENFFAGKTFAIPSYQRDYAWTQRNVDDLFEDVEESIEVGTGHYLGTFIVSWQDRGSPANVVDGQQRLTTITMLLDALIAAVAEENIQQHYRNTFINHPVTGPKLRVLGDNEQFFRELLQGGNPAAESDGQQRLLNAYKWIRQRVHFLTLKGGSVLIQKWLLQISSMEVLEFVESNEGKAIRMFQSVNDRGMPLARMDKAKSLLVYFSNRFLGGELDQEIADLFGRAFRSFSRIKRLSMEPGYIVRNVSRDAFREDDVLRYHYLTIEGSDYWATMDTVLDTFLKPELQRLRHDPEKLRQFISDYSQDMQNFFTSLEELLQKTRSSRQAFNIWVIQDLSATLYPLVIRANMKGWLDLHGTIDARTLIDIIEMVDLRVFKLRGTNPQADIFKITRDLQKQTVQATISQLQQFCDWGMSDAMMASRLIDEGIFRNPALPAMLLAEESLVRQQVGEPEMNLSQLSDVIRSGLTVEHILPQDPANSFDIGAYGFDDTNDYERSKHRIGNLVLLEGVINSACQNRTVEAKISSTGMYPSSTLSSVRALAAACASTKRFDRTDVADRSKRLATLMLERWPIRTRNAAKPPPTDRVDL